jgi:hypothetical protein
MPQGRNRKYYGEKADLGIDECRDINGSRKHDKGFYGHMKMNKTIAKSYKNKVNCVGGD